MNDAYLIPLVNGKPQRDEYIRIVMLHSGLPREEIEKWYDEKYERESMR